METPLQISHPSLEHARKLTPLELNSLKYANRHTLLTPDLLRGAVERKENSSSNGIDITSSIPVH